MRHEPALVLIFFRLDNGSAFLNFSILECFVGRSGLASGSLRPRWIVLLSEAGDDLSACQSRAGGLAASSYVTKSGPEQCARASELLVSPGSARAVRVPDRRGSPGNTPTPAPASAELLFHEPWWLAAATQGRFQEVMVKSGDRVVGRLPFVVTRKMGFTALRMPPFTHLLGPAVDAGSGKAQTQLLRRLSVVRELLDQLPPFDFFKQAFRVMSADGLAFQDRGFQISPQYTFQIDCRHPLEQIWQDMQSKTRQHIRRAEEKFSIDVVEDPCAFVRFYAANLRKYGRTSHIDFTSFGTLFDESRKRDSGEILSANWPDGTPTAMVYLVWGHGTMYYLLSTRAADAGDNGSVNLLIWSAIKRAHSRSLVFDLDGVSSSGTARFLSGIEPPKNM